MGTQIIELVEEKQMTDIEAELSRIWNSLEGSQKTWASLFNIVFFTTSKLKDDTAKKILSLISKKFPCRSIFIFEDEASQKEYLKVNVTSEAIGEGDLSVVCDHISIEVAGQKREEVPFLILPTFFQICLFILYGRKTQAFQILF